MTSIKFMTFRENRAIYSTTAFQQKATEMLGSSYDSDKDPAYFPPIYDDTFDSSSDEESADHSSSSSCC